MHCYPLTFRSTWNNELLLLAYIKVEEFASKT